MRARLPLVLLAISSAAWGADWEFDCAVKAIEHQYGVRQMHVPLMGVASFFVKVVRPGGATGFKLAVFENLRSDDQDQEELDRFMDRIGESGLHRLLRVHSRRDGQSAYIYLGDLGRTTRMLLVTFDRNEATVMQVNLNVDALLRMLNDPDKGRRDYCCGAGSM
ncbi:MAG: hypothetical protein ABSB88_27655 [Bryobacteraceae bacterium]|jgi:hypothetical protein